MGRNLWQDWLKEEILPQRHFENRFRSTALLRRNRHLSQNSA